MSRGKLYITGGVGSRYDGESFGEAYELPPDQCYCETCAAIGSFFWNWRMLLITGESRYADLMERLMYNGILSSPSLSGTGYFYVNPLMLRDGKYVRLSTNPDEEHKTSGRPEWHSVSCCPPNVMRFLASLSNYFVTLDENGIQIQQYGNVHISYDSVTMGIETEYPWDGQVKVTIQDSSDRLWKLSLRIPGWCQSFSIKVNGEEANADSQNGYVILERTWKTDDVLEADFEMPAFLVEADPRVDSVRGCVAIQRGPIVYCLEEHDQEAGVNLLDVKIDLSQELIPRRRDDLLGGVMVIEGTGNQMERSEWQGNGLYRPLVRGKQDHNPDRNVKLVAIPYYAWGNRGLKSMRVWTPATDEF
jgi:hypothetical protein